MNETPSVSLAVMFELAMLRVVWVHDGFVRVTPEVIAGSHRTLRYVGGALCLGLRLLETNQQQLLPRYRFSRNWHSENMQLSVQNLRSLETTNQG